MVRHILIQLAFWSLFAFHGAAAPRFTLEVPPIPPDKSVVGTRFAPDSTTLIIDFAFGQQSALWDGQNLLPLPAGPLLDSNGLGTGGVVCGSWGEGGPIYCGVIYANGTSYDVGTFGGVGSAVYDFNTKAEFVGTSSASTNNSPMVQEPFIWRGGKIAKLNELLNQNTRFDEAFVINEQSIIYGVRYIYGPSTEAMLVRLTPDGLGRYDIEDLHKFPVTDLRISKSGSVGAYGLFWSESSGLVPLSLGVENRVWPQTVNIFNETVGLAEPVGAFFFDGVIYDLNKLVSLPAGWQLNEATDLNDYGQIAVMAYTGNRHMAVRLTPDPKLDVQLAQSQIAELTIRTGANRRLHLQTSADFVQWKEARTWDHPQPSETLQVSVKSTVFFRLIRD